ncbi:MAG: M56 family metallopeptidase [Lachnospiraceae bacterium]|nr:M56 family metallopeptidase [Lachnospiraceae bacterium]
MNLMEMGFQASLIIIVVIICRSLFINRLPKRVFLVLWFVVLIRLLVPYSFPSIASIYSLAGQNKFIMDKAESLAGQYSEKQEQEKNTAAAKDNIIKKQTDNILGTGSSSIWRFIWIAGTIVCAAVFIIAYILCYKRFCISLPVSNPVAKKWLKTHKCARKISIRQSCLVKSPLSYGILHPVILMPETTNWENTEHIEYILEHEFVHIKRFDAAAKLFLITAVSLHWFNPLVWVMYILLNRDIELACDETVIKHFGEKSKKGYAMLLINMEEEKYNTIPLGSNFSRNAAEERITAIMKTKRISRAAYIMAVLLVASVISVFATSASGTGREQKVLSIKNTNEEKNINTKKGTAIKETEKADKTQDNWVSGTYSNIVGEIAAKIVEKGDYDVLIGIAPFAKQEDLDKIAKQIAEKGDYEAINNIISYISEDAIQEIQK